MDMFLLGDEVVPRFSPVFALSHGNNLQKSDVFFFPHKSIINQVKSLSLTIYKACLWTFPSICVPYLLFKLQMCRWTGRN